MEEEGAKKVETPSLVLSEEEKSLITVSEKIAAPEESSSGCSIERDTVLEKIEKEKKNALIKAWEENEKAKTDNKAHKKKCGVESWEKTKIASVEAEMKKIEEEFKILKAEFTEKMKNKAAEIHKEAEEKRAEVEAKKEQEIQKIQERAEKFRAIGNTPKKLLGFYSFSY